MINVLESKHAVSAARSWHHATWYRSVTGKWRLGKSHPEVLASASIQYKSTQCTNDTSKLLIVLGNICNAVNKYACKMISISLLPCSTALRQRNQSEAGGV